MDVINLTEAPVDLDDPPKFFSIDTTDVENILAGTYSVRKPAITEKMVKSTSINEFVETL